MQCSPIYLHHFLAPCDRLHHRRNVRKARRSGAQHHVLRGDLLRLSCRAVPNWCSRLGPVQRPVYTWAESDGLQLNIGFLGDLCPRWRRVGGTVRIPDGASYTIGDMADDTASSASSSLPSLCTFSDAELVMAKNFAISFRLGTVGVGLVPVDRVFGTKATANVASLKAFPSSGGGCRFRPGIAAVRGATPAPGLMRRCFACDKRCRANSHHRNDRLVGHHFHLLFCHRCHGNSATCRLH